MFWIILIIAGALLIKLGALSVLVSVFAIGFKAAILVIALISLTMIWLQYRKQ